LIFGIGYQYPFGRRFGSSFGINGPISALSGKKCNKINVEQMTFNQEVSGSIPDALTKETQKRNFLLWLTAFGDRSHFNIARAMSSDMRARHADA
jgi:hypothetical protein